MKYELFSIIISYSHTVHVFKLLPNGITSKMLCQGMVNGHPLFSIQLYEFESLYFADFERVSVCLFVFYAPQVHTIHIFGVEFFLLSSTLSIRFRWFSIDLRWEKVFRIFFSSICIFSKKKFRNIFFANWSEIVWNA